MMEVDEIIPELENHTNRCENDALHLIKIADTCTLLEKRILRDRVVEGVEASF